MIEMFGRTHLQGKGNRIWPSASSLFSPAGRSAERMRGDEGGFRGAGAKVRWPSAPLIRRFTPPSPRWGEEGGRRGPYAIALSL